MDKFTIIAAICGIILISFSTGFYLAINEESEWESKLTIIDDYGRDVSITINPQRIISLSPSTTEILFAV